MSAPEAYIEWVNAHLGFNPRSQANSNALSDFIVTDLRRRCPALLADLDSEKVVPAKNAEVLTKVTSRNVDLVLKETKPSELVRVSIENKTIMAAHGNDLLP